MEERKKPESSNKNRFTRREFLTAGGVLVASAALFNSLYSCTTTNTSTASTTTAASTALGTSTALTPRYGGTLRIITGTNPTNSGWPADPTINQTAIQLSCDTLLRGDNNGNVIPWLAESYKIADDRKSITFSLRKGVKFHDQSDFNASVVKWNLDNFIDAGMQANWASVEVIDDYNIRVNFTGWQNTLLSTFVEPSFPAFMISKVSFDKYGKDWMRTHPVGTGPFIFDSSVLDVSYKVVKNPDWWVKGRPYLEGINFNLISSITTQKMVMKAGDADLMGGTASDIAELAAAGFPVKVVKIQVINALIPDTANADSPWANQKVREAVEYAIDKEAIAKAFGYGYATVPYQIIPPACTLAYNTDFTLGRKFDLDKAKQLLAEAGYSNGFETTIVVQPMANLKIPLALQADLDKVGVKVNFDYPDMGKWAASYMNPKATWHNSALYYVIPTVSGVDFATGLQFVFSNLGQSWLRPPELNEAYQSFLTSPTVEIEKVRAVTDMITKEALMIPVDAIAGGYATRNGVVVRYDERSSQMLYNAEDWGFSK